MNTPSIRRSLLIRCGIGVGALLCALSLAVYLLVSRSLIGATDRSISQTAALLSNQVELEASNVVFEWQEGLGSNESLTLESLFQFWDDRTGSTTRSPALKSTDLPKFHGIDGAPVIREITLPNGNRARAIGLRVHPFVTPEEQENMRSRGEIIDPGTFPHTLVVASNTEPLCQTLDQLRYAMVSGALLTLALGFTIIDHVISLSLTPINDLTRQMRDRSEHQLDSALTLPGKLPSELSGLASNFDSLLARVANIRQREKDFIRHAAHELRTPIAALRATTELALSKPRDAHAYAAHLESCRKSADDLGELVSRLSSLARIGRQSSSDASIKPLDPREQLDSCLPAFVPTIENRGIKLSIEPFPSHQKILADPVLTRLILNNLLDNAASYTPEGGEIRIRCQPSPDRLEIVFSNPVGEYSGDPERLFEPLFRNEYSRQDSGSHLGIGLTLSRDAATSMGCHLNARITPDNWIEFTFSAPSAAD